MPSTMKSLHTFSFSSSFNSNVHCNTFRGPICSSLCNFHLYKSPSKLIFRKLFSPQKLVLSRNHSFWRATQIAFCYAEETSEDLANNHSLVTSQYGGLSDGEELELLDKPSPILVNGDSDTKLEIEPQKPDKDEVLEPFLKFFKSKEEEEEEEVLENNDVGLEKESPKVGVEYYEPKPGDFVVGVVVSGNENKLDVNVGADVLGTMLTKEILPLYSKEMEILFCDLNNNAEEFMSNGKIGILRNEDAVCSKPIASRPVVDAGTVVFAEVLGRTLSGRPLLSCRRFFRRIAWQRVRQVLSSLWNLVQSANCEFIRCLILPPS